MEKKAPFTKEQIAKLVEKYPTPFYIYGEEGVRASARKLIGAFSWNAGFKEYFAVKATPNPSILNLLKKEGCGADCSSLPELILAEQVDMKGEEIMFTSNDTSANEFIKAKELGAIINVDDISHIPYLEKHAGLPGFLSFRYNPGSTRTGNSIIGKPEEAKFGLTKEQLFEAYKIAKEKGITRFGLHTMLASNELDFQYFVDTAGMLFDLAKEIEKEIGITLEFINLGGGIGIPYKPGQKEINLTELSKEIEKLYNDRNLSPLKLFMECGRYITGPHGYLVTKVRHLKETYKKYAGLDASMADLMRPGMYGAYHHISVLGKENETVTNNYDVTGSLCENNDKFAIDRELPILEVDDFVLIHDVGAHGHSMGFNYNGKLRPAEFLLKEDVFTMIRRAETIADYFSTLNFGA